MKKVLAIIVSVLFVLSVAGLAFAADQKAAPSPAPAEKKEMSPAKTEAAPAAEKKAPAKVKQVTGEVAAVDAAAKTLTVKAKKGDVMLSADDKTKFGKGKTIADIKVGDKVTVKYAEMDGKMVAKSVTAKAAKAEKKEAAPAEKKETKPAPAK
ncbi:MAG TPA: DUF5666 domain-containing protein [Thermodesulfovibrionales bacterium]|nr:DUF5666 domain-containing protein [Thermodesulfovibrionales bacterium]